VSPRQKYTEPLFSDAEAATDKKPKCVQAGTSLHSAAASSTLEALLCEMNAPSSQTGCILSWTEKPLSGKANALSRTPVTTALVAAPFTKEGEFPRHV
jgi:hypothetical protein